MTLRPFQPLEALVHNKKRFPETQEKLTSTTRTRHGARNWRALALPQYTTGAAKSKTECPSINQTNKDAWGGRILSDFCELCLCVCE